MTESHLLPRPEATGAFLVAALYHFARFERFADFQTPLQAFCDARGIKGTLLIAREGINGTVAGSDSDIAELLTFLRAQPEFTSLEHKESRA